MWIVLFYLNLVESTLASANGRYVLCHNVGRMADLIFHLQPVQTKATIWCERKLQVTIQPHRRQATPATLLISPSQRDVECQSGRKWQK